MERETAQGQYEIHLEEGDNTIVFLVTDEKGNTATYRKDISLDTSPPQLSVRRNLDQVTTDDSYVYVEGYTEAGVRLTCNGGTRGAGGKLFQLQAGALLWKE